MRRGISNLLSVFLSASMVFALSPTAQAAEATNSTAPALSGQTAAATMESISTASVVYGVTNTLSNITSNNDATTVQAGSDYVETLTADDGYALPETVKVTLNGHEATAADDEALAALAAASAQGTTPADISYGYAWDASTGTLTIPAATGDNAGAIEVEATATEASSVSTSVSTAVSASTAVSDSTTTESALTPQADGISVQGDTMTINLSSLTSGLLIYKDSFKENNVSVEWKGSYYITGSGNQRVTLVNLTDTQTVTFDNANIDINGNTSALVVHGNANVEFNGANSFTSSDSDRYNAVIYHSYNKNMTAGGTLNMNINGSLNVESKGSGGTAIGSGNTHDMGSIVINTAAGSTLTATPGSYSGISIGSDGANDDNYVGDLTIKGSGTVNATVKKDDDTVIGIGYTWVPSSFTPNLTIEGNPTITTNNGIGAFHGSCNMYIHGGNVTAHSAKGTGIGGGRTGNLYILIDGGTVDASGAYEYPGIGSTWAAESNCTIDIKGGTVTASGGKYSTGIGGSDSSVNTAGKIGDNIGPVTVNISGGYVTATGGDCAAGIGGGYKFANTSTVNITGGDVTATGGEYGAGIGSGEYQTKDSTVSITGGTIEKATGGDYGAGIGGGDTTEGADTVTIGGSALIMEANGGAHAAAIGAGYKHYATAKVTVSGGKIMKATGGVAGAGIGSGQAAKAGMTINLTGGLVDDAKGGSGAAGIGGSEDGSGTESIVIDGGSIRRTTGGDYGAGLGSGYGGSATVVIKKLDGEMVAVGGTDAAGIGGGASSEGRVEIHDGNIRAISVGGGAGIGGGSNADGWVTIDGSDTNVNASDIGNYGAGIGGGDDADGYVTIRGGTVYALGGYKGAGIGGGCDYAGKVTITGGIIDAYGGTYAPGIGDADDGTGGFVTIMGGTITATGGDHDPGIGNRYGNRDSKTTITGGSIKATPGADKAEAIIPYPTNGSQEVFRTELTIPNVAVGSKQQVTSLAYTQAGSALSYGTNDIWTLDQGKVYAWLPAGNTNTAAATANDAPYGYTLNAITDGGSNIFNYIEKSTPTVSDFTFTIDGTSRCAGGATATAAYNGKAHPLTATANYDGIAISRVYYVGGGLETQTPTNVGFYDIYVTTTATTTYNPVTDLQIGKLIITKASDNTITPTNYEGTYDGQSHTISVSTAYSNSTLYYSTDNATWSTTVPTFWRVGAYTVYIMATNPNCEDSYKTASVTINKRSVTITADSASVTYTGQEQSVFSGTYVGIADGDELSARDPLNPYASMPYICKGTNVGIYQGHLEEGKSMDVVAKVATAHGGGTVGTDVTDCYTLSLVPGTLTINKAAAKGNAVSVVSYEGIYDGSAHTITASTAQKGSTLYYSTVAPASATDTDWSETAPTFADVGTYTVYVKATNPNYEDSFGQNTVTIIRKTATVTANDKSKARGADDPAFDATVSGMLGTDTLDYTLSRTAGETPGTYTITPAGAIEQGNYRVTYATGTLTITKASTGNTVTATPFTGAYDGTAHSITATASQPGSTLYYSLTGGAEATDWSTTAPTWTDATTAQTVYVKAVNPDYVDAFDSATVTVTAAQITIAAASASKVYDGTALTNSGYVVLGFSLEGQGFDSVTVEGSQTDVGSSANTVTGYTFAKGTSSSNYAVSVTPGTLKVSKANGNAVTVTDYMGAYDGSEHGITATAAKDGSTLYYSMTGGESATDWSTTVPTLTNVGTQVVYVKAVNANYTDSFGQGTVTVAVRPVTVTANSKTKTHGDADPAFDVTVAGTLGTDTVAYTLSRAPGEDVGTYAITPAGDASQGNYQVTFVSGTLTIAKEAAEQNAVTATNYSSSYDGASHGIAATSKITAGTTLYYSKTGGESAADWSTTAPTWKDVTAAQTVYVKAVNPSYADAYGQATVTIAAAPVTVTANDKSKTYGTDDPTLTATVSGTLGTDTVVYTISRAAGEDAGTYAITPAGDASQGNYTVAYQAGTLTIDASSDNYVSAAPYTGIYDGTAHGITATAVKDGSTLYYSKVGGAAATDWSTTAPTWTDVTAAQTVYVKAVNPNYADSYGQATVTISQRAVSVTAASKTKVYGAADPALTATVSGTLGADTVAYTLARTSGEDAGTYAITPAGDATQGNYAVTYATGTLTIVRASGNDVSATAYNGTYDGAAHGITATAVKAGSALYYSKTGGAAATDWSTTAPTWTDVTAAQTVYVKAVNPNYADSYGQATVTIAAAPVTVTANDKSKTYGTDDPALTATVSGTLGADTVAYTLARTSGEDAGTYAITPAGDATQGNYAVAYQPGTLTIGKASGNVVTATAYDGTYDGAAHTIAASAAKAGSTLWYSKVAPASAAATDWSTTAPTWTDVTAAQTVYVKATNPNYEDATADATVTITAAPITITAVSDSKVFDGTALTNSGYNITGSFASGEGLASVTVSGTQTHAGSSDNVVTGYTLKDSKSASNYVIATAKGTLTVSKAAYNAVVASGYAGVYDSAPHGITAVPAVPETAGTTLYYSTDYNPTTETGAWSTTAPKFTDAGTYTVYVKAVNPDFTADAMDHATVEIATAPLTITAGSKAFVYDGNAHSDNSWTITSGKLLGTDAISVVVSGGITNVSESPVTNTVGDVAFTSGRASNYTVTKVNGTLTMMPSDANTVTVTPYSGTYDGQSHTVTATASIADATLYYSTVAPASATDTDWKTTAPTWTGVTAAQTVYVKAVKAGYTDATGSATVTITQAPLTIRADDKTFYYTDSVSGFTATETGYVNGETAASASIYYSITFTDDTTVGTHPIGLSGKTSQGNYSITYVNGTATILKAPASKNEITATGWSDTYDGTAHGASARPRWHTGTTLYYSTDNVTWTAGTTTLDLSNVAPLTNAGTETVYIKAENPNFETSYAQTTVTVAKRSLTLTGASAKQTYTGSAIELTDIAQSGNGLAAGQTLEGVTYSASGTNVGTYQGVFSGAAAVKSGTDDVTSNYAITTVPGTLTITKAAAEGNKVTATAYNGTYDGAAHGITATATQAGSTLWYSKVAPASAAATDWSTTAPTWTDVTAAQTVYVKAVNPNYDDATESATVTISQRAVTVTGESGSKVFTGSEQTLSKWASDGLVDGQTLTGLTYAAAGTGVGTYTGAFSGTAAIASGAGDVTGDYKIETVPGTLTITSSDTNYVSAVPYTGIYDGTAHTITASAAKTGSTLYYSETDPQGGAASVVWLGDAPTYTRAGIYTVYVKATNSNYADCYGSATVTISRRTATITANSATVAYTGSEQSLFAGTYLGVLDGYVIVPADGKTPAEAMPYVCKGTNVGVYPGTLVGGAFYVKVTDTDTHKEDVTDCYDINLVTGTLTITPASGNYVSATAYNGTYDGAAHGITATAAKDGSTLWYSKVAPASAIATDWSTTAPTWTDVTAAQTVYVKAVNPNYADSYGQATVTISQRAVTVTGESGSKVFTGSEQTLSKWASDGLVDGQTLTGLTYAAAGTGVGTYTGAFSGTAAIASGTGDVTGDYKIETVPGTLTITKAAAEGNKVTATAYNGTYDGAAHGITATATQAGSTLWYSKVAPASAAATDWSTTAPTWTDVTAAQTVYVKATNPNYEDATADATVTITAAPITITAGSKSFIYDGSAHGDSSWSITSGKLIGADAITVNVSGSIKNVADSPQANTVGTVAFTSGAATNYQITKVNGTLVATKAPADQNAITTTAYSGTYDGAAHTITASAKQAGSTLKYSITDPQGGTAPVDWTDSPKEYSEAGNYTVYVKAANPNYEDSYGQTNVAIAKRNLTLTGESATSSYTGGVQTLGNITSKGLVEGQALSGLAYAATGTDVGTYRGVFGGTAKITSSSTDVTSDYTISTVPGTLTITKAAAEGNVVTATDCSATYDGAAHTIIASAEQAGSTLYYSKVGGESAIDWSTTAPTWTDVTAAQTVYVKATNPNYADSYGQATVTITAAPVTVTANDADKTFGETDPTLTATVSGLVNGESASLIKYSLARTSGEDAGTYAITPSGDATQGNYAVAYQPGTLTIDPEPVVPVISIAAQTYTGSAIVPAATDITVKDESGSTVKTFSADDYVVSDYADNTNAGTAVCTITFKGNYEGSSTAHFAINPAAIAAPSYTPSFKYDGKTHVSVDPGTGEWYTVSDGSATNAGTYTAKAVLKDKANTTWGGGSTEDRTYTWTITPTVATVTANAAFKEYGAADPKLSAVVTGLVNGESESLISYALSRKAGENVGDYAITASGATQQSNYVVTYVPATFKIVSIDASNASIDPVPTQIHTGNPITPDLLITFRNRTLVKDTDYTVVFSHNTDIGTAQYTISYIGNYNGTENGTFTIAGAPADTVTVSSIADQSFTGAEVKPAITVKDGEKTLVEGTDYTVAYSHNVDVGEADCTVTLGSYYGGVVKHAGFNIVPAVIAAPSYKPSLTFDGTEQTSVASGDWYTVTGGSATDAGSYTATVALKDKANTTWGDGTTADRVYAWNIVPADASGATVSGIEAAYVYTGSAIAPAPTVTLGGKTLVAGTDYTVAYASNTDPGQASWTITFEGNYTSAKPLSGTFTITAKREAVLLDDTGTGVSQVGDGLSDVLAAAVAAAPDAKAIEVDLKVSEASADSAPAVAIRALPAASGLTFTKYYDATLTRTVDGVTTDIGSSNDALIGIAYPFDFTGKDQVHVFAYHGTQAYELTDTPNADGEYSVLDRGGSTVTVYAKRYSTFAIAYGSQNAPGGSGSASTSDATARTTAAAQSGNSLSRTGDTGSPWALVLPVALVAGVACIGVGLVRRRKSVDAKSGK